MDRSQSCDGEATRAGNLVYVMGASGAGKDTLLRYARARLGGREPVLFAHRYITREAEPAREDFVPLGEAEFEQRAAAGLFALHWRSHGCRYGVGVEIDRWFRAGFSVVVNGSRRSFADARQRYPGLVAVLLTVQPTRLQQRRVACGRGDRGDFDASLDREVIALDPQCVCIANDGPVGEAGEALVQVLSGGATAARRSRAATAGR